MLLKKILSPLLFPLPFALEVLILGLLLLWFTRRQKTGKFLVCSGVVLLLVFSNSMATVELLRPLERQFPPLVTYKEERSAVPLQPVRYVVVLAAGHKSDPRLPVTSQITGETAIRLLEGIRLLRSMPGSRLVLSGGTIYDPIPAADVMAKVAQAVGVSPQDIVLERASRDTEEQAQQIKPIVGLESFLLVTSAAHMPRSMAIFRKQRLSPIAAPTDFWVTQWHKMSPDDFYPDHNGVYKAERAVHEYLGLVWATIRGKV